MSAHSGAPDPGSRGRQDVREANRFSVVRGTDTAPPVDARQATACWARAQIRAFAGDGPIPEYGTAPWLCLPERDPRRYAALIVAAEQSRPRHRERPRREPTRRRPPHELRATPGWPPVAIPGCPGAYLTASERKAA